MKSNISREALLTVEWVLELYQMKAAHEEQYFTHVYDLILTSMGIAQEAFCKKHQLGTILWASGGFSGFCS